eukprot:4214787-Prymnesium_polylepis.1
MQDCASRRALRAAAVDDAVEEPKVAAREADAAPQCRGQSVGARNTAANQLSAASNHEYA